MAQFSQLGPAKKLILPTLKNSLESNFSAEHFQEFTHPCQQLCWPTLCIYTCFMYYGFYTLCAIILRTSFEKLQIHLYYRVYVYLLSFCLLCDCWMLCDGVQANANTILIYVTLIPVAVKSIQFSPWLHFIAALYVCWLKNSCVI